MPPFSKSCIVVQRNIIAVDLQTPDTQPQGPRSLFAGWTCAGTKLRLRNSMVEHPAGSMNARRSSRSNTGSMR